MAMAGVLGRGEYLKLKTASNCTSSSSVIVCSNSASVSPGNPTMISVVMEIDLYFAARIHAMRSRYCSRVYSRAMAARTRDEPLCTGRCTWSQSVGTESMASTISRAEMARMRGGKPHPADSRNLANLGEQLGKTAPAQRVAVGIHILPEQLNLGQSAIDECGAPLPARIPRCGCARVRGCRAPRNRRRTCRSLR